MKIKNFSNSPFLRSNSTNNLSNSLSPTIRISEIDPLYSELTEEGLLETSFLNPEGSQFPFASKKISIGRLGNFIGNNQIHENLLTNDKTIIGAINELKLNGSGLDLRDGAGHNSIFRGKWLGPYPNADQYEAIDSGKFSYTNPITGNFEDIYVGDYWQSDGPNGNDTVWRVACLDYYYNAPGDRIASYPILKHHAVIVPDTTIVQHTPYNPPPSTIVTAEGITPITDPLKGSYIGAYHESYLSGNCLTKTVTFTSKYKSGAANKDYDNGYYFSVSRMSAPQPLIIEEVLTSTDNGETITRYPHMFRHHGNNIELDTNNTVTAGTLVYITYKYKVNPQDFIKVKDSQGNDYNNLLDAKQIVYNFFGQEHIMPIYIGELRSMEQSGQWYQDSNYGTITYGTDYFSNDVIIPTIASFLGQNWINSECYFKREHQGSPTNNYIIWQDFYESHRLPLFVYNPNLINNRNPYFFRDMLYEYNDYNAYERNRFYHCIKPYSYMSQYGVVSPLGENESYNIGIRPMFSIYKGETEE